MIKASILKMCVCSGVAFVVGVSTPSAVKKVTSHQRAVKAHTISRTNTHQAASKTTDCPPVNLSTIPPTVYGGHREAFFEPRYVGTYLGPIGAERPSSQPGAPTEVPEPGTLTLFGFTTALLFYRRYKCSR